MLGYLQNMMTSTSAELFEEEYEKFQKEASVNQLLYFQKNWMSCKEKWVKHHRRVSANTNNHVESINSKLKMFIRKNSKIDDCLTGLLKYIDFLKNKYMFNAYLTRSKIIKYNDNEEQDPIINDFYQSTTKTLANYLLVQYQLSKFSYDVEDCDRDDQELDELTIFSDKNTHTISGLQKSNQNCTCHNFVSNSLPCKHIFFVRRLLNRKVFESYMIPERYQLNYSSNFIFKATRSRKSLVTMTECESTKDSPKLNNKRLTSEEKYNMMWRPMQEMCQCFARFTDEEFYDNLALFMLIKEYFEKKVNFIIYFINYYY